MQVSNSFEERHDDYGFFLSHSTEPQRCRAEVMEQIKNWPQPTGRLRILDFGCGCGEFLSGVLADWSPDPETMQLTLLDVDPIALRLARNRMEAFSNHPIEVRNWLEELEGPFHLVLSNHVLYYVQNLERTVGRLWEVLSPGAMAVFNLGGSGNQLCRLWKQVFEALGQPLPFFTSEDVGKTLRGLDIHFERRSIPSVLSFPDCAENRLKIARFVFGPRLSQIGSDKICPLFDQWKSNGLIVMQNEDDSFCISKARDPQ